MRAQTPKMRNETRAKIEKLRAANSKQEDEQQRLPEWLAHVCQHERTFADHMASVIQCKDCGAYIRMEVAAAIYPGDMADQWRGGRSRHEVRMKYDKHNNRTL